jgi:hypothetical protein
VQVDTNPNPVGTYTLISIDDQAVPCDLEHGGHPMTVQSGRFIIREDGTCSSRVTFCVTPGEDVVRDVNATYIQDGPTLTMSWKGAGVTTGTVDGNTFTMNNEGMIFAYAK